MNKKIYPAALAFVKFLGESQRIFTAENAEIAENDKLTSSLRPQRSLR